MSHFSAFRQVVRRFIEDEQTSMAKWSHRRPFIITLFRHMQPIERDIKTAQERHILTLYGAIQLHPGQVEVLSVASGWCKFAIISLDDH